MAGAVVVMVVVAEMAAVVVEMGAVEEMAVVVVEAKGRVLQGMHFVYIANTIG